MNDRVLVITDNEYLFINFKQIISDLVLGNEKFDFKCSSSHLNELFPEVEMIDLKKQEEQLIGDYEVIISLHCKQLFPPKLVRSVRCINIHPGYNPYNRGWYPQVFSIINKLPIGATIHEIDEQIDHGKIIVQKKVDVFAWDTSLSLYDRVIQAELQLLREYLPSLINNSYDSFNLSGGGNLNLKQNFLELCHIDLKEDAKVGVIIDRLRALSHGDHKNLYFIDEKSGKKVYVSVKLEPEE